MASLIQLIAGLSNPGPRYAKTRHNVGAWFIEALAESYHIELRPEQKFNGQFAKATIAGHECYLLIPATYMNESGSSIYRVLNYYKIPTESLLVVHDELDLSPGDSKLKFDGGHGGHNGLRNIIDHCHSKQFWRLRLGIGKPAKNQQGTDYVLGTPSAHDKQLITQTIDDALFHLPDIISGKQEKAMKALHTKNLPE